MTPRAENALSGAAFAGMFVFGIVMAMLGATLPSLSERLRFGVADIGTLFLAMNSAMLVTSLLLGVAMDRFGMKPPLTGGPLLVAAALLLISRAAEFHDLLPPVVLMGAGGGALNGATNTLVADLHRSNERKASALNLLGVFFGFGALFLPFWLGALMATFGIAALLTASAALCLAASAFAAVLAFPPPKQRQRLPVAEMPDFLRSALVLSAAALLFFQSGVEFTLGGFIATFLTREMNQTLSAASWALAGYWAALMLARVLLSRVLLRADPHAVVTACAAIAGAGAVLTALSLNTAAAIAGILLSGFALAGIYPTVLGVIGAAFREHSGTVFGILFTVALAGGMTIPWLAGNLAAGLGMRAVFWVVAAAFASILALSRVMRCSERRLRRG